MGDDALIRSRLDHHPKVSDWHGGMRHSFFGVAHGCGRGGGPLVGSHVSAVI